MKGLTINKIPDEIKSTYTGVYTLNGIEYGFEVIVHSVQDSNYIESVDWIDLEPDNSSEILDEIEYYFTLKFKKL